MFDVILPKNHPYQNPLKDSFLEIIKKNQTLNYVFRDQKNATFILTQDPLNGFYGGALLLKQKLSFLHKDIRKSLFSQSSQKQEIWTGNVSLYMTHDLPAHFESLCKSFYQNLYAQLVEFGIKEKISFLCVTLEPGEYLCTEAIGLWPYVVEVRPQDSSDGLFHGILSLTHKPSQATFKIMETLHTKTTKLAA